MLGSDIQTSISRKMAQTEKKADKREDKSRLRGATLADGFQLNVASVFVWPMQFNLLSCSVIIINYEVSMLLGRC